MQSYHLDNENIRQLELFQWEKGIDNSRQIFGGFLTSAKITLLDAGKPLSIAEITRIAFEKGSLISEGKTPQNTMRARLSEELRKNGATSQFQRVGKNRFALRDWKLPEYIAPQFSKSIPAENVVCFDANKEIFKQNKINGIFKISSELKKTLQEQKVIIVPRKKAETIIHLKQLVSYVLLRSIDGNVLTYIRGKYSSAHKTLLKGKYSLGFGGHVLDKDLYDLFSFNDCGVKSAAVREISEELKSFIPQNCEMIRVIHDCTSTEGYKHFAIVLESLLPKDFNHKTYKKELSINGIKLYSPNELWENLHLFEYWSQLIIKNVFDKYKPNVISTISPSKRPKDAKNIILVGEIASGKTSILTALTKSNKFCYVSARQCLVEILNIPDFKNKDRSNFQEKAQELITSPDGPSTLANKICNKINQDKITLIDGIRNISTIKELKNKLGDSIIVYVDCPRDKACENYKKRAGKDFNNYEFVKAREHATEQELPLILAEADAILFNADELQTTINIFKNWLN